MEKSGELIDLNDSSIQKISLTLYVFKIRNIGKHPFEEFRKVVKKG